MPVHIALALAMDRVLAYTAWMHAVRHARSGDAEGILRTLHTAFEPYRDAYTPPAFRDTVLDPESLHARLSCMSVFVAERDGEIVGTIAAEPIDGGDGRLRGMAVLPAHEHTGVGRALLRRAIDELVIAGCRRATLGTTPPLVRAQRFYERSGFSRTGVTADFFGMPLHEFGAPMDSTFEFRDASSDDAGAILQVINAAFVVEGHFVTGDRIAEAELRRCFGKGSFMVAARPGQPPSASVFLRPESERRTYVGMLAVDPAQQRRRLGSLMMAAAERRCRLRGDEAIDISVVNLRTELPPFYRARGFVETGTAPFEDPRAFRPAHFIRMTLRL